MKVAFKASFTRDLRALKDAALLGRMRAIIESAEKAQRLEEVRGVKRLHTEGDCYRIRVGDYRIGISVEQDVVIFVRVLHRREVYRYFP